MTHPGVRITVDVAWTGFVRGAARVRPAAPAALAANLIFGSGEREEKENIANSNSGYRPWSALATNKQIGNY